MTTGAAPMCAFCEHFNKEPPQPGFLCRAFPDGIPKGITDGDVDHRKPVRGDRGIRFKWRRGQAGDPDIVFAQFDSKE